MSSLSLELQVILYNAVAAIPYLEISFRHTKNMNGLYNPNKRQALCSIVLTESSSASQFVSYIRDISHYM